ncbi:MAG: amylo-alpha-1,6-glucosidase [Bacteroidetes bacterium]|nr:amylo-alpha-1,6-glucosidase [Bacteroidota bacterium]MBU1719158.1 amylo-alpha-1,6-glucosidase [Bacteroidota bacterium]
MFEFDKTQLINLEYSLSKELIRTNRAGSFASTTIIGCNTRKYHGLLITPQPAIDDGQHVLLSTLDETIIQRDAEFNLAIHKYPGIYNPKGHKYIREFFLDPTPRLVYRVGGVVLSKEMLFLEDEARIVVRYTLEDAHSYTILRLRPFLAFRNVHALSKANVFVDRRFDVVENGIKTRLYQGYSFLYMQLSKENEYISVPDWYYDIEYPEEMKRGYECHEDLFAPGYFELPIKKGESIVFSAGLTEKNTKSLNRLFNNEIKKRVPRNSFENCLKNSAQQFFVKRGKNIDIIAGFPWFGRWGRDTFISLPGLTLAHNDERLFFDVVDTMLHDLKGPFFPNTGTGKFAAFNSVDTSLWFFWAMQKYTSKSLNHSNTWKVYGWAMKQILYGYRDGNNGSVRMLDNGLLYAGLHGFALTWMDAIVAGKPVTPRIGMPVEINALWYNAIMFTLELATLAGDAEFVAEWHHLPEIIRESFKNTFWEKDKGYLADYVDGEYKDFSVRPNMLIAVSLPYSPVSEAVGKLVLDKVKGELLTPRGIRSLSPKNPAYVGTCEGSQTERDMAYHQGSVWPWLLAHFTESYLKIHGAAVIHEMKQLYQGLGDTMSEHGINSVSEIYDGDPPHTPRGTISQAWSVAEVIRMGQIIADFEKDFEKNTL